MREVMSEVKRLWVTIKSEVRASPQLFQNQCDILAFLFLIFHDVLMHIVKKAARNCGTFHSMGSCSLQCYTIQDMWVYMPNFLCKHMTVPGSRQTWRQWLSSRLGQDFDYVSHFWFLKIFLNFFEFFWFFILFLNIRIVLNFWIPRPIKVS
jgi:hypothetical protein